MPLLSDRKLGKKRTVDGMSSPITEPLKHVNEHPHEQASGDGEHQVGSEDLPGHGGSGGFGDLHSRRLCDGLWRRVVGNGIDVVEGEIDATHGRKGDETAGTVGRNALATLVVADVPLRAADPIGKHLLRDAEALTDGSKVVHGRK